MPLTEIEGYCFLPLNSFGLGDLDDGAARLVNVSVSSVFLETPGVSTTTGMLVVSSCLFAVNYVLKVPLRHGMCDGLSAERPCERVKVGQLLGS